MKTYYAIACDLEPDDSRAAEFEALLIAAQMTEAEVDAYLAVYHKEPS